MRRLGMISLYILGGLVLLVVAVVAWNRVRAQQPTTRALLELGTIEVPRRLQGATPGERPDGVTFIFDNVADSFLLIGSNTPIQERLTVAAWPAGGALDEQRFQRAALDRLRDLRWRAEGALRIGEGIHEVNTHETPGYVLIRDLPGESVRLGYMAWAKNRSLDEGKALLAEIAASFRRQSAQDAFFAIVRERPFRLATERRAALAAQLGRRGVTLTPDGPPVVAGGTIHDLETSTSTSVEGLWFTVLHPLGTLANDTRTFRQNWAHPMPPGFANWPRVMFFQHRDGAWAEDGAPYQIRPALADLLAARHVDPGLVYVYAAFGLAVDETPVEQSGLENFLGALPYMQQSFDAGDLLRRIE